MSQSRHCEIYKAVNQKWYLELGDFEYADHADSTTYGPFESYESAYKELDNHSNPGSLCTDESGKQPVPTKSPNGNPIKRTGRMTWGGGRYWLDFL